MRNSLKIFRFGLTFYVVVAIVSGVLYVVDGAFSRGYNSIAVDLFGIATGVLLVCLVPHIISILIDFWKESNFKE